MNRRKLLDLLVTLAVIGLTILVVWLNAGCTTVRQSAVEVRNAGFYAKPMKRGDVYVIDDAFRDRYNALIDVYGASKLENGAPRFVPPLVRDRGISPGPTAHTWLMTFEAMEDMGVLDGLKRRGAAP